MIPIYMSNPAGEGMNPELTARIDAANAANLARGHIACADILVARHGKAVYYKQYGWSDVEADTPLGAASIFRLASMSKPVAAVSTMMLAERGLLSIDDPVSKYLPTFADPRVAVVENGKYADSRPATRELRLRDLLTHSGGIGSAPEFDAETGDVMPKPGETLADAVPRYGRTLLMFDPGTAQAYSGLLAFDTLARVVEIVSGKDYETFLRKELCGPLGMDDTTYLPTEAQQDRIVAIYAETPNGRERVPFDKNVNFGGITRTYFSGGGGLLGTVPDYYRFASMLARGGELGGVRILAPETVAAMRTAQLPAALPGLGDWSWGLGMRVVLADNGSQRPLRAGAFGWSGAYGTHFWIDPAEDLVAVYMSNMTTAGGAGALTAREIEQLVYEAL